MPELPEVETTRRGIEPHILNQGVTEVMVRNAQLRWPVPESIRSIVGDHIAAVNRRGKYLLLEMTQGTVMMHLGMSGSLRVCAKEEPYRKHDHFICCFETGTSLRFHDPRRFGAILWTAEEPYEHPLLAELGPEPLSSKFNAEYLYRVTRNRRIPIKSFIMNSHVVVGVGNIYANEALFMASIRPGRAAGRLTKAESEQLVGAIKRVLKKAIQEGGTTLRDFLNAEGNPGYFVQSLQVYGRDGAPCQQCHRPIKRKVIAQRASYYCPACQT
ncbi:MAG TPA: DNA-formamidopyrimidine glycosylase [Gammaproteobacteria bacterium]|nr:DNA-formamidopyrimidine glycosylase [Gammaproteobacteria bacterium]